jgi:hypothetical protein
MHALSPLSPIVWMKLSFHECFYIIFTQSELIENRIKRRSVFPCHFDNPIDVLQAKHFQFCHGFCSVLFKQILLKKVQNDLAIKLYPRLEANPEVAYQDLRFPRTSSLNSRELESLCKTQTGLNRTQETPTIHILPKSRPKGNG